MTQRSPLAGLVGRPNLEKDNRDAGNPQRRAYAMTHQFQTERPQPIASRLAAKFSAQRPSVRILETSAAAIALAAGVFWASLVASPKPTEAGTNSTGLDVAQITLTGAQDLPSFDDTYQRHTGVLDTLRR